MPVKQDLRGSYQARLPGKGGMQDENQEEEQEFTSEASVSFCVKWE